MSNQREKFLSDARARWTAAIEAAIGDNLPARSEWTDLTAMRQVMEPFMGEAMGHTFLPTGGGMDMRSVRLGHEKGTLELRPGGRTGYIFKPTSLAINYFAAEPAQSFIFIHCAPLKPTGVYGHPVGDQEEVTEISRGDYRVRPVWDRGYLDHDDGGREIPLPDSARVVCRFLKGSFMIAGNGSLWNGTAHTYDGEHDKLGEAGVRDLIERAIKAKQEPSA